VRYWLARVPETARPDLRAEGPVLTREDALWLNRVTFGLDEATVAQYRLLGREGFSTHSLRIGARCPMRLQPRSRRCR